ncbi:MAG: hypothetical protein F6J87_14860 [Spirulina sp. SIO3F2]|nr:hypothetical protein [Spirulina sp. SIO3F2]
MTIATLRRTLSDDGKTIVQVVCDSIALKGNTAHMAQGYNSRMPPKFFYNDDIAVAGSGDLADGQFFERYLDQNRIDLSGLDKKQRRWKVQDAWAGFNNWYSEQVKNFQVDTTFLMAIAGEAYLLGGGGLVAEIESIQAIGAGDEFAIGAMEAGASALEAALIAIKCCAYCEEPLHIMTQTTTENGSKVDYTVFQAS